MEVLTKIIEAFSSAAWPTIAFYVVWTYRKEVSRLIESAGRRKFTIVVGGQRLTMEEANQGQRDLIGDLQKQVLELKSKVEGSQPLVAMASPKIQGAVTSARSVLWVDDDPKNNSYFIELLEKRGYQVDPARTTAAGIKKALRNSYRLILSDMGREENGRFNSDAGVDLLQELTKSGSQIPFAVYCSEGGVQRFRDKVKTLGGKAITSSPIELRAVLDEVTP
jgi:CheY-like chemotaxis protein